MANLQQLTRGLYYQHTNNGWLCILTVPYETLLQGVQSILVYYGIGLVFFLVIAVAMWLRDRRLSQTAKRTTRLSGPPRRSRCWAICTTPSTGSPWTPASTR